VRISEAGVLIRSAVGLWTVEAISTSIPRVVGARDASPLATNSLRIEAIHRAIVGHNVAVTSTNYLTKEPMIQEAAAELRETKRIDSP